MKHYPITIILLFLISLTGFSQPVQPRSMPPSTFIQHYRLDIGTTTTTVLIFPSKIEPGDKGISDREFIAQIQPGFQNILKLKATRKGFTSSNLHVFTSDGKVWAFDVDYVEHPDYTTYDLNKIFSPTPETSTRVLVTNQPINPLDLDSLLNIIKISSRHFNKSKHRYHIGIKLNNVGYSSGYLFFNFKLSNHSNLDYPIDFFRAYIKDQGKLKRSSIQDIELKPIYQDTTSIIKNHSSVLYALVVPSFTIPDKKECYFEIYEVNGGRNLHLEIKNKVLFKTANL